MINTILSGLLEVSMNVLNWFLTPIWNLLDNINIGGTSITDLIGYINDLFTMMASIMTWVIDATGIPPSFFLVIFGVFLTSVSLRIGIYLVKMILRWWDKIIA